MEERRIKYAKNLEYAVKIVAPVSDYKDEWKIYDRIAEALLDTAEWTEDELTDVCSEVVASWNTITEEEYNEIVGSEKKED